MVKLYLTLIYTFILTHLFIQPIFTEVTVIVDRVENQTGSHPILKYSNLSSDLNDTEKRRLQVVYGISNNNNIAYYHRFYFG